MVLAIGITGIVWAASLIAVFGRRKLATAIGYGAIGLSSMNGLRFSDRLTISDVLLLASIGLFAASGRLEIRSLRVVKVPLLVVGMLAFGGILGVAVYGTSAQSVVALTTASTAPLIVVALWQPTAAQLRTAAFTFAAGVLASALFSVQDGRTSAGGRLIGLTVHPNHLGLAAVLGIGAAMFVASSEKSPVVRRLSVALSLSLMGVVALSGSRAAVMGAVVTIILIVHLSANRRSVRWLIRIFLIAGATVGATVWSGVLDVSESNALSRMVGRGGSDESNAGRVDRLGSSWDRIAENPIVGDGFAMSLAGHSVPLQVWQGAGVLGLAALVVLFMYTARSLMSSKHPGLWAGYCGYLTTALVSNLLWDRFIWVALALAAASTSAGCRESPTATPPIRSRPRPAIEGRR